MVDGRNGNRKRNVMVARVSPERVIAREIDTCPLGEAKKLERRIADALRKAGYLKEEPPSDGQ
jgi:hypothetical protein